MPEKHPISDAPDLPLERRVQLLEIYLAQAWDQIWWLSLTPEKRAEYEAEGHTAPIQKFYFEVDENGNPVE